MSYFFTNAEKPKDACSNPFCEGKLTATDKDLCIDCQREIAAYQVPDYDSQDFEEVYNRLLAAAGVYQDVMTEGGSHNG